MGSWRSLRTSTEPSRDGGAHVELRVDVKGTPLVIAAEVKRLAFPFDADGHGDGPARVH
jgi:hypothetical protein